MVFFNGSLSDVSTRLGDQEVGQAVLGRLDVERAAWVVGGRCSGGGKSCVGVGAERKRSGSGQQEGLAEAAESRERVSGRGEDTRSHQGKNRAEAVAGGEKRALGLVKRKIMWHSGAEQSRAGRWQQQQQQRRRRRQSRAGQSRAERSGRQKREEQRPARRLRCCASSNSALHSGSIGGRHTTAGSPVFVAASHAWRCGGVGGGGGGSGGGGSGGGATAGGRGQAMVVMSSVHRRRSDDGPRTGCWSERRESRSFASNHPCTLRPMSCAGRRMARNALVTISRRFLLPSALAAARTTTIHTAPSPMPAPANDATMREMALSDREHTNLTSAEKRTGCGVRTTLSSPPNRECATVAVPRRNFATHTSTTSASPALQLAAPSGDRTLLLSTIVSAAIHTADAHADTKALLPQGSPPPMTRHAAELVQYSRRTSSHEPPRPDQLLQITAFSLANSLFPSTLHAATQLSPGPLSAGPAHPPSDLGSCALPTSHHDASSHQLSPPPMPMRAVPSCSGAASPTNTCTLSASQSYRASYMYPTREFVGPVQVVQSPPSIFVITSTALDSSPPLVDDVGYQRKFEAHPTQNLTPCSTTRARIAFVPSGWVYQNACASLGQHNNSESAPCIIRDASNEPNSLDDPGHVQSSTRGYIVQAASRVPQAPKQARSTKRTLANSLTNNQPAPNFQKKPTNAEPVRAQLATYAHCDEKRKKYLRNAETFFRAPRHPHRRTGGRPQNGNSSRSSSRGPSAPPKKDIKKYNGPQFSHLSCIMSRPIPCRLFSPFVPSSRCVTYENTCVQQGHREAFTSERSRRCSLQTVGLRHSSPAIRNIAVASFAMNSGTFLEILSNVSSGNY
ncbi:hypothetical protein CERZMDRAFT_82371 [Cercospora zeae-maydis SCOH1-5]|uniref:Uncharacterized protein n=1 Tax=Cercospora zeae-maydis SCOH1-5 TaxID=717836 RepID=A0A6A6FPJ0_9PEZI|nr:hypothetical protein CERZMDRAFT_82371 [Cercospora zeae-maydis SCOH1-5]